MSALDEWKSAKQRVTFAERVVAEAEAKLAEAKRDETEARVDVWVDGIRKMLDEIKEN